MKANTSISENGTIVGALTDENLELLVKLINNIMVVYFGCGHGIHKVKRKEFVKVLKDVRNKE